MIIEGVPYYRFRARFRLANGKRRQITRWCPGWPWVRDEIGRELLESYGRNGIKPGSCRIEEL